MRNVRFLRRRRFKSWSSGLWCQGGSGFPTYRKNLLLPFSGWSKWALEGDIREEGVLPDLYLCPRHYTVPRNLLISS